MVSVQAERRVQCARIRGGRCPSPGQCRRARQGHAARLARRPRGRAQRRPKQAGRANDHRLPTQTSWWGRWGFSFLELFFIVPFPENFPVQHVIHVDESELVVEEFHLPWWEGRGGGAVFSDFNPSRCQFLQSRDCEHCSRGLGFCNFACLVLVHLVGNEKF